MARSRVSTAWPIPTSCSICGRSSPGTNWLEDADDMRVLVADDSVLLREGLFRLLDEAGHTVVAAVGDAPSLVPAAVEHRPEVAIVDIRMPPTMTDDGLRAAVEARRVDPGLAVLLLSAYLEK